MSLFQQEVGDAEYGNIFEKIPQGPLPWNTTPVGFGLGWVAIPIVDDPLGGMEITGQKGFAKKWLTNFDGDRRINRSRKTRESPYKGGYDVSGQSRCCEGRIKELVQASPLDKKDLALEKETANYPRIEKFLLQLKEIQKQYWKS